MGVTTGYPVATLAQMQSADSYMPGHTGGATVGVRFALTRFVIKDDAGNVGIGPMGAGQPAQRLHIADTLSGNGTMQLGGTSQFHGLIRYEIASGDIMFRLGDAAQPVFRMCFDGSFQIGGDSTYHAHISHHFQSGDVVVRAGNAAQKSWRFGFNGDFSPGADATQNLGRADRRWATVFASSGTINTSDAREKNWLRSGLTDAELAAGAEIARTLGWFQWLSKLGAEGDGARVHFGAPAQQVWSIMAAHGLVDDWQGQVRPSSRIAILCWDPIPEESQPVLDARGRDTGDRRVVREASDRFSLNLTQLCLFLAAVQARRLDALELSLQAINSGSGTPAADGGR